ncbi:plasmid recombination protein, partial [Acinetobacter lactucae]
WIENQYGSNYVVPVSINRDETTPHLIAYVVPLDEAPGKLNAKKWLGGRAKISHMQIYFSNQVKSLCLERGIELSKAIHTRIK